jgi:hypothetical protein
MWSVHRRYSEESKVRDTSRPVRLALRNWLDIQALLLIENRHKLHGSSLTIHERQAA